MITSFFSFFFLFFFYVVSWCFPMVPCGHRDFVDLYFCFDLVSVYLVFLTVVISVCVLFLKSWLSDLVFYFVLLSNIFSLFCYTCCHVLLFWVFYELSIITLLFLLIIDSPYSERYSAFWYFLGYIVFCSLPMLLVLLYFADEFGSFSIVCWDVRLDDVSASLLLLVLFSTKIPLFPFQTWLPIVHAESSSIASMCLSGYIMKLGVLGIFRFCSWVVPGCFLFLEYCGLIMLISAFFVVCSIFELDCKRWLAFLSLAHISIIPLCMGITQTNCFNVMFCYCLGHGLSSSVTFLLLWFLCEVTGSRNWLFMKSGMSSSFVWLSVVVSCICFCSSFPPCLQFFSELSVLGGLGSWYGVAFCLLCVYLFLGGLIPFVCLGSLLVRRCSVKPCLSTFGGPLLVLAFLVILNFGCFLFF